MDFSNALRHIKAGKAVQRKGWNGVGMYAFLGKSVISSVGNEIDHRVSTNETYQEFVALRTPDKTVVPYVVAQTDMLAEDWLGDVFDHSFDDLNELPRADYKTDGLDFPQALLFVKAGRRAQRTGWNGPGQFIFLVPGSTFQVNRHPLLGIYPEGTWINYHGHVDFRTSNGVIVPWTCSQTDMLEKDWRILPKEAD